MMKKTLFFFTSVCLISSCSVPSAVRLTPTMLNANNSVTLKEGYQIVSSKGETTEVALTGEVLGELTLMVACFNTKGEAKNIIPAQIEVVGCTAENQCSYVKVYSEQEYLKKMQTEQRWLTALEAGSTSLKVSNAQTELSKQIEQAKGDIQTAQLQQDFARSFDKTKQKLLKDNTVNVGETIMGKVMVAGGLKYASFKVTVPFGNEKHIFYLVQDPPKQP
jgi:hypothetical protein